MNVCPTHVNRRTLIHAAWWGLCVAAAAAGCGGAPDDTAPNGAKISVAVSIAPQAWLVDQIGGEHVHVMTVVQPGASPATYQPTDAQVSRLMQAAVYFRTGVPFENGPWFAAVAQSARLRMVDLRSGVAMRVMASHYGGPDGDEHGGGVDPHIWLSPRLLKIQARTVAETLREVDPSHRSEYEAQLAALLTRLDTIDTDIRETPAAVAGQSLFVFHPAWGYFTDEYGLKQIEVEVEGKAPTDHDLTALQALAREHGATVIFVQPQIASRYAQAVADAVGGRVATLDPLAYDIAGNLRHAAQMIAQSYP